MKVELASAVYRGRLAHARRGSHPHAFAYDVAMLYLDLDELPRLLAGPGPLREGRRGLLSFWRADYLAGAGDLASAARDRVEAQLGFRPAGPVRLLTHVRWLGHVFNPVSFYYLFDRDGRTLRAVLAEVTNTPWGERHAYALAASADGVRASSGKALHVSPFLPMSQRYAWRLAVPGQRLTVAMTNLERGPDGHPREVFRARLALVRRPWSAGELWRTALGVPAQGAKALGGIYWQALVLWLRGAPFHDHPRTRPAPQPPPILKETP